MKPVYYGEDDWVWQAQRERLLERLREHEQYARRLGIRVDNGGASDPVLSAFRRLLWPEKERRP